MNNMYLKMCNFLLPVWKKIHCGSEIGWVTNDLEWSWSVFKFLIINYGIWGEVRGELHYGSNSQKSQPQPAPRRSQKKKNIHLRRRIKDKGSCKAQQRSCSFKSRQYCMLPPPPWRHLAAKPGVSLQEGYTSPLALYCVSPTASHRDELLQNVHNP